jgi:hypothetical protein
MDLVEDLIHNQGRENDLQDFSLQKFSSAIEGILGQNQNLFHVFQ